MLSAEPLVALMICSKFSGIYSDEALVCRRNENCILKSFCLLLIVCSLCVLFRYQIGLRYTGGARMLLMLSLKFGILPIVVPVGVRDFDIDGELWVKLRLIPSEPWVGAVSCAFVSLPKIKFVLSPFRLFNLMGM